MRELVRFTQAALCLSQCHFILSNSWCAFLFSCSWRFWVDGRAHRRSESRLAPVDPGHGAPWRYVSTSWSPLLSVTCVAIFAFILFSFREMLLMFVRVCIDALFSFSSHLSPDLSLSPPPLPDCVEVLSHLLSPVHIFFPNGSRVRENDCHSP